MGIFSGNTAQKPAGGIFANLPKKPTLAEKLMARDAAGAPSTILKNAGVTQPKNTLLPETFNFKDARQNDAAAIGRSQKTPIDQRIKLGIAENDSRDYIGTNLIPAYEEDAPIAKVGKGIVNYGIGGLLSLASNIFKAPVQGIADVSVNTKNLIEGKPADFSEKSLKEDILPAGYGKFVDNLAARGALGSLASGAIQGVAENIADPAFYIGGGILDDMAKVGTFGAASKPFTKEALELWARNNLNKAGKVVSAVDNVADNLTNKVDDVAKKADDVPTKVFSETPTGNIPTGKVESGFSKNIRTDTAMLDDIRASFDETPLSYDPITNKETLSKAQTIFDKGQAVAEADFYKSIGSNQYRPEDAPLAKMLAKQALEQGDVVKARQILSATADKLTSSGQFSQAAKILREADPQTFLMTIDSQIKKLNADGLKQYGKKWTEVVLTPDEIKAITSITDPAGYDAVWEQIGNRIAKNLPSTATEKFDSWRRIAMLLNPKTHIRNTVGNVIMGGMQKTSDTFAALLEKIFVPTGQRTKSLGWSFNKNVRSLVDDTWTARADDILNVSKWDIGNLKTLGTEKDVFKNKLLQGLNDLSFNTLNFEDNIFTKQAFRDSLGQYIQANKLTEVTEAAFEYAKRRALEATFKQTNALATALNKLKQIPVAGKFVDAAIPFTKTPANIAARALDYSPIGIFKSLYDVAKGKTAAMVIEDFSKGLTGTGIVALGMQLNAMGWAKAGKKSSANAEALSSAMGEQQYSLNTPLGSMTLDWAQPFALPFFMGVALNEALKNNDKFDYDSLIDALGKGGDTFFNLSMMQNIKEIMGGWGSTTEAILDLPRSYVMQGIPSVLGQTARTADDTKRSIYDPNSLKEALNQVLSKIPGASEKLEPALDIWGNEQSQGGAVQQFIFPGYIKAKSDDPTTIEMARLYSATDNNDMLPKVAPTSFTAGGEKIILTAQEKTLFQREMGTQNYNEIKEMIHSTPYVRASDDEKAKLIKKIVNDNYDEVKAMILDRR